MRRKPDKSTLNPWVRRALVVVFAAGTLLLGYLAGNQFGRQHFDPGSITLLPEGKALPEFELVDQDGKPFTKAQLEGKWNLVFFGYTYCPDICPTTLTRYTQVTNRLQDAPEVLASTRVLFVSVDPKRDPPERLKEYVHYFNPEFSGATGDPEQIASLAKTLALFYEAHEPDENGNYSIDHSAAVAIIDPHAKLVGYFNAVLDPAVIAADYRRLVEKFGN